MIGGATIVIALAMAAVGMYLGLFDARLPVGAMGCQ